MMQRYHPVHVWMLGLIALLSADLRAYSAEAQRSVDATQIPSGAVACYFAGRAYLSLMADGSGQGQVVEYFTNIGGILGSLFKGPPSESTAFFTLRSNLFSFKPVRTNGDIVLQLVEAGTFDIYYNPNPPNREWSNLDEFSSGQLVARFARPESLVLQILQTDSTNPPPFESLSSHPVSGTLTESQSFTFKGQKYDFSDIVPGGITHNEFISNTGVPGIAGFPIGLAYAGHCLAVARKGQD